MMMFKIDGVEHTIGDIDCPAYWSGYPKSCICGGLVHAEFGDENWDCDHWLYYSRDKCQENWDIKEGT